MIYFNRNHRINMWNTKYILFTVFLLHFAESEKILSLRNCKSEPAKIQLNFKNTFEFSICLRFTLEYLTSTYLFSSNLTELYFSNFEDKIGFVKVYSKSEMFMYSNEILPNHWQHLCYAYNSKYISITLNGELLTNDIFIDSDQESIQNTTLYLGDTSENSNGNISDFNVWNRALKISEMKSFTTDCNKSIDPDVFSWKTWIQQSKFQPN